jgi:hypothetical protein
MVSCQIQEKNRRPVVRGSYAYTDLWRPDSRCVADPLPDVASFNPATKDTVPSPIVGTLLQFPLPAYLQSGYIIYPFREIKWPALQEEQLVQF